MSFHPEESIPVRRYEDNNHGSSPNKARSLEEKKEMVLSHAFWMRKAVLQECSPEVAAHYGVHEMNPDKLWTPLIAIPQRSIQYSGPNVIQIRLFRFLEKELVEIKKEPEEPDVSSMVCEILHGRASPKPHPGQNSRHDDYSTELTMDGRIAYVSWDRGIHRTDHAHVTKTEQDSPGAAPEVRTSAVNILGEMSDIISGLEKTTSELPPV